MKNEADEADEDAERTASLANKCQNTRSEKRSFNRQKLSFMRTRRIIEKEEAD